MVSPSSWFIWRWHRPMSLTHQWIGARPSGLHASFLSVPQIPPITVSCQSEGLTMISFVSVSSESAQLWKWKWKCSTVSNCVFSVCLTIAHLAWGGGSKPTCTVCSTSYGKLLSFLFLFLLKSRLQSHFVAVSCGVFWWSNQHTLPTWGLGFAICLVPQVSCKSVDDKTDDVLKKQVTWKDEFCMIFDGQPTPFFFTTEFVKSHFPCRSSTITRLCETCLMGWNGNRA